MGGVFAYLIRYTLSFTGFHSVDATALSKEVEAQFKVSLAVRVGIEPKDNTVKIDIDIPRYVHG